MEFSRQEYWSVLPFHTLRDRPNAGMGSLLSLLHWQARIFLFLTLSHMGVLVGFKLLLFFGVILNEDVVDICIQICEHTLLWGRYLAVKFLVCSVLFHTNSLAIYIYISNLCPMEGYKMNETYSLLGEIRHAHKKYIK